LFAPKKETPVHNWTIEGLVKADSNRFGFAGVPNNWQSKDFQP